MAGGWLVPLLAANLLLWLLVLARNLHDLARRPTLQVTPREFDSTAPLVSVLIPARNEAGRILERSVRAVLAMDYPRLEVIAVDDRSTDRTADILKTIAAGDQRLKVIDGVEPPTGWLGKPHAMQQAWLAADGEWLCGTDADIEFAPMLMAAAMTAVLDEGLDGLTLIPNDSSSALAPRLVMPVAIRLITFLFPPNSTANPRDRRALGCGAFLLLRREALAAVGGYEAVREDVADDVGLATAIKHAGFRLRCAEALDLLSTPMYNSLGELWRGFSKNSMRGVRNRRALAVVSLAVYLAVCLFPVVVLIAAAAGGQWALAGWSLAAVAAQAVAWAPFYAACGLSPWWGVAGLWGMAVMAGVLANALLHALTGRGIDWRGRRLPPA